MKNQNQFNQEDFYSVDCHQSLKGNVLPIANNHPRRKSFRIPSSNSTFFVDWQMQTSNSEDWSDRKSKSAVK
ncbi:hypothetical protein ACUNWD_07240 [Sunxiuqinia sp. A32]|uniref:hypothetical protein n=1 Tax=Sunxiuqinia sp. A32 TaxID=3461496 RepID=UPI0040459F5E